MKRVVNFMLASVTVLAVASCQKEMANDPEGSFEVFTVTASIGTDTKTVLEDTNEGNKIYWTPGDQISLFNTSGAEVVFSTDITEKSASATFENQDGFEAPENLLAVYPTRTDKTTTYDAGTNVINTLHIGGTQTAVAGSFDPQFAVAVGTETAEGKLSFKNVHSLIKFTIGGDTAPTTVTLKNNGSGMIAGNFNYDLTNNIATATAGASTINLTGTFEVGETYYIAMEPVECVDGISLLFDGVTVKNTGVTKTFEPNKIYNLGTVEMPAVTEEPVVSAIDVARVWGHYGESGTAWSNSLVPSLDGNDRNLAMDDEYIYIPETNKSGNIHKFKVSDGTYVGTLPIIDDLKTGTHYTSCARMAKNSDPAINGGKDVLVVCNLAQSGETLVFVAYTNGTNNEPVKIWSAGNGNPRRFGDKFTVYGDYSTAKYWVRNFADGNTLTAFAWPGNNYTWLEGDAKNTDSDSNNIGELAWYPGQDSYCLISTTSVVGAHLMNGANEVKTYPALAKTFGYNFFEAAGEKFVAWTSLFNGNDKPRLQIVQSDASTLEKMQATFDNLATRLVYEAPLQNADDMDTAGVGGGNTVGDCCVREINGEIYIAAMAQKAGLSLFKVTAK